MRMIIYLDDPTVRRLRKASEENYKAIEEMAENAVAEAALDFWRGRDGDPGSNKRPKD